jgi:hypothetical protein
VLCLQRNDLSERVEFYFEECKRLSTKYESDSSPRFDEWQHRRLSKMAQLEALNVELERMVGDLEEARRRDAELRRKRVQTSVRCEKPVFVTGIALFLQHTRSNHDCRERSPMPTSKFEEACHVTQEGRAHGTGHRVGEYSHPLLLHESSNAA